MKKFIAVFTAVAFVVILTSPVCYGAVGYKKDGTNQGAATDIDFRQSNTSFDGSTVTVYSNGYKGSVTTSVSTASNLTSAELAYGVIKFSSGTAKTICIYAGSKGQMITLMAEPTVTITIDQRKYPAVAGAWYGWNTIQITGQSQTVTLLYFDDTFGWIIVGNAGATIT